MLAQKKYVPIREGFRVSRFILGSFVSQSTCALYPKPYANC